MAPAREETPVAVLIQDFSPILVAITVGITLLLGLWLGPVAQRRPFLGPVVLAGFGALAVAAAASLDGVSVVGTAWAAGATAAAGTVTLGLLLRTAAATPNAAPAPPAVPQVADADAGLATVPTSDRRTFLVAATVAGGTAALGLVAARQLAGPSVAADQRAWVRLPRRPKP